MLPQAVTNSETSSMEIKILSRFLEDVIKGSKSAFIGWDFAGGLVKLNAPESISWD